VTLQVPGTAHELTNAEADPLPHRPEPFRKKGGVPNAATGSLAAREITEMAPTASITLITKVGTDARISKHISLDTAGKVRSDATQCLMVEGDAVSVDADTAAKLAACIASCRTNQAVALGALQDGLLEPVPIVTERSLPARPGAIARCRRFIDYRQGRSAWALIDFDTKGMPSNVASSVEAAGGMLLALFSIVPGLQRAARVSRASTSAGLYRTDTGARLGGGGAHHYVLVKDGGDIARFLKDLHDRCWLHGLGWHLIGGAGQLLERSLVDRMVGFGERLCFEGAPSIELPLAQDQAERNPQAVEGEVIDTELMVPRLSEYERHLVDEAKALSTEALAVTASEVRTRHDRELADKLSAQSGMPIVTAVRLIGARHRGVLLPCIDLDFDHLGMAKVGDVLANPDRFVNETLADPMEGAAYGRCKAKVLRSDDGGLLIHSFAHGNATYRLRHDARSAKIALNHAPADGVMDHAIAIVNMAELEPDEIDQFTEAVAKAANIGKRAVVARFAKAQKAREEAARNAAAASGDDARIVRPRPPPDGEVTPTVTFLDELLAADVREEPPMRDGSGNLVEVRVREPWELHLLTSDRANGDEDDEAMKPPAEPALVRLSPVNVVMLVERYVRWSVEKKDGRSFAALPRPHIDALMQLFPSRIPIARAINTAPLISPSGDVIDGAGLDRDTGLVHQIDPLLRACVPSGMPTPQDVRNALAFLLDEWLVDVALDPAGKCTAVMLTLTLIERVLLPERPAFFVTAGQRGGGKTTLVNMVTLAALGRRAAAAAWSDNTEERKKALFSYLRQGVACVAWDNVARGASISCPHVEAALTAPEISDRILGVSRVETVPSTTVQIFTGNAIMPRGDMASRSLVLALDVDRPDPENRAFTHTDALVWTRSNRAKIVRACYTLLLAGAQNRPPKQEPKTRFKTWWKLIGWPIEYAAGLLGIDLDCAALLQAGERADEDAMAASAALESLFEVWGSSTFTAKELAKFIAPPEGDLVARGKGEAVSDALSALTDRPLAHPTPQQIGRLLQARLVNRPTWLGDGQRVATLRRNSGHNENRYQIEVSNSGADVTPANVHKVAVNGAKHTPHSPLPPSSSCQEPGSAGSAGSVWRGRL
jgi:hypothetical protein